MPGQRAAPRRAACRTDDYILKARWRTEPTGRDDLDVFKTKVKRKVRNALGILISVNGFSGRALAEYHDSSPFVVFTGDDIFLVLAVRVRLDDLVRAVPLLEAGIDATTLQAAYGLSSAYNHHITNTRICLPVGPYAAQQRPFHFHSVLVKPGELNRWVDLLGRLRIDVPVAQAGMAGVAGARVAGAVAEAGGLGTIGLLSPRALAKAIRENQSDQFRDRLSRPLDNLLLHNRITNTEQLLMCDQCCQRNHLGDNTIES